MLIEMDGWLDVPIKEERIHFGGFESETEENDQMRKDRAMRKERGGWIFASFSLSLLWLLCVGEEKVF